MILVVNGLGFEGWMDRLTEAAGYKGPVVAATTGIEPLQIVDDAEENGQKTSDGARADQGPGRIDPHAWQSLANARIYVQNIADGLVTVDPAGAELYRNNAARFLEEIDALEAHIGGTLYSDALSTADGPAGTYLDMMRHNAETLAAALGG